MVRMFNQLTNRPASQPDAFKMRGIGGSTPRRIRWVNQYIIGGGTNGSCIREQHTTS